MVRNNLKRGFTSCIASLYNSQTDLLDSSATDATTSETSRSRLAFLPNCSTPPPWNDGSELRLVFKKERSELRLGLGRDFIRDKWVTPKGEDGFKEEKYGISILVVSDEEEKKNVFVVQRGIKNCSGAEEKPSSASTPLSWKSIDFSSKKMPKHGPPPTIVSAFIPPVLTLRNPIFNKSLGKFPNHYVLVLQHGKSVRHYNGLELWSNQTHKVTPHGLWPPSPSDIDQPNIFEDNRIPDINYMCNYWPNILGRDARDLVSHKRFWSEQWVKHGSKSPMDQEEYMKFVVELTRYFGPIVDMYLARYTRKVGERDYLDVTKFLTALKVDKKIFARVSSNIREYNFDGVEGAEFQELSEVKIYLDGSDPWQTIDPTTVGIGERSGHRLDLEMNVCTSTKGAEFDAYQMI